jgi:hypothetical protein
VHTAKETFAFYAKGFKRINAERKVVRELLQRQREEREDGKKGQLSRDELQLVRRNRMDMKKCVTLCPLFPLDCFSRCAIRADCGHVRFIPFAVILAICWELTPLVALKWPSILPPTLILPSQRSTLRGKREKRVQEFLTEFSEKAGPGGQSALLPRWLQDNEGKFDETSREDVVACCRYV